LLDTESKDKIEFVAERKNTSVSFDELAQADVNLGGLWDIPLATKMLKPMSAPSKDRELALPERKWFGATRAVTQQDLQKFHEALALPVSATINGMSEPIKVVKAPEGSLQRAAFNQTELAKERQEIRTGSLSLDSYQIQKPAVGM